MEEDIRKATRQHYPFSTLPHSCSFPCAGAFLALCRPAIIGAWEAAKNIKFEVGGAEGLGRVCLCHAALCVCVGFGVWCVVCFCVCSGMSRAGCVFVFLGVVCAGRRKTVRS